MPVESALAHRHPHRRGHAPLRTPPPRIDDPRRRQKARQHPPRRQLAVRRPRQWPQAPPTNPGTKRRRRHNELLRHAYVHTVIDDHSRAAYAEIHDDETAITAAAVLQRAVSWFAARGVIVERVLYDNGGCYRSKLWTRTCAELDVVHKRTRPYRPQTNGKIERFHRTMAMEWAFARHYTSGAGPPNSTARWLHAYRSLSAALRDRQESSLQPFNHVPGQYT
ncbi:DDE-type integrase/transposase/recombinase [Rhodococcus qingshengii]|nr:DDE-type integrase/transposase/recombinase [Rhodococcus qingshengii]